MEAISCSFHGNRMPSSIMAGRVSGMAMAPCSARLGFPESAAVVGVRTKFMGVDCNSSRAFLSRRKDVDLRWRGRALVIVARSGGGSSPPYRLPRVSTDPRRSQTQQEALASDAPLMNSDIGVPYVRLLDEEQNMIVTELRAKGSKNEGIGSRRRKRGLGRKDTMDVNVETEMPFLEPTLRKVREEGHQILGDVEELHLRATNPFGLVLEICDEANEYMRNNKEESITRKPILKIISDKINDVLGEDLRDAYIRERADYTEFEKTEDPTKSE